MKSRFALAALVIAATSSFAQGPAALKFDLKDPKGVNSIVFFADGGLEPFRGLGNDISGEVQFDPAKPEATTGNVIVGLASLTGSNNDMAINMKQGWCLDVDKYPTSTFVLKSLKDVNVEGRKITAKVIGDFSIKGVTKSIEAPITAVYHPDKVSERLGNEVKGDLLLIRSRFTFKRSDYKIGESLGPELVSDEIEIDLNFAATCIKSKS